MCMVFSVLHAFGTLLSLLPHWSIFRLQTKPFFLNFKPNREKNFFFKSRKKWIKPGQILCDSVLIGTSTGHHTCVTRCTSDRLVVIFAGTVKYLFLQRKMGKKEWWMSIEYTTHHAIDHFFSERKRGGWAPSLRLPWQCGRLFKISLHCLLRDEKYTSYQVSAVYLRCSPNMKKNTYSVCWLV